MKTQVEDSYSSNLVKIPVFFHIKILIAGENIMMLE